MRVQKDPRHRTFDLAAVLEAAEQHEGFHLLAKCLQQVPSCRLIGTEADDAALMDTQGHVTRGRDLKFRSRFSIIIVGMPLTYLPPSVMHNALLQLWPSAWPHRHVLGWHGCRKKVDGTGACLSARSHLPMCPTAL